MGCVASIPERDFKMQQIMSVSLLVQRRKFQSLEGIKLAGSEATVLLPVKYTKKIGDFLNGLPALNYENAITLGKQCQSSNTATEIRSDRHVFFRGCLCPSHTFF